MRITKKQTMAAVAAGILVAVAGGTGVAVAAGNPTPGPVTVASTNAPGSPATAIVPAADETTSDGADQGPDADATEPGHQDANEADDTSEGPETAADDGADQGPDADATEPGHQDANEADDASEGPESAADDASESTDAGAGAGADTASQGVQADD